MNIEYIKSYLGDAWTEVTGNIGRALESDIALLNRTNKAILTHPGKQLRPILSLLVAKACSASGPNADSCRFAAAAELLHNATLLHDDVADESDTRRGVPTINSLLGPSVSVLVGDYWLVAAMNMILQSDSFSFRVVRIFAKTMSDLAKGEMLQLQKAGTGDTSEDDYYKIIYYKTASLFEASALSAAISVAASEETEKAVTEYAVRLGAAFQIKDDIFDYLADASQVGKPLGVDILEQKITLPLLQAMAHSGEAGEKRIRAMVTDIHDHPEYRDGIVKFVHENDGIARATKKLDECVADAVRALEILPDSEAKELLVQVAHYVAKRNY